MVPLPDHAVFYFVDDLSQNLAVRPAIDRFARAIDYAPRDSGINPLARHQNVAAWNTDRKQSSPAQCDW